MPLFPKPGLDKDENETWPRRVLTYIHNNFEHLDNEGRKLARKVNELLEEFQNLSEDVEQNVDLHEHTHDDTDTVALDHGTLTGLADNDHPQYLTEAEADLLYVELDQAEWTDLTDGGSTVLHTHASSAGPSVPGFRGEDGDPGFFVPSSGSGGAGTPGADGADGAPGAPGVFGADGDDGMFGVPGRIGSDGAPGAAGPAGVGVPWPGPDGDDGLTFPGPAGATGATGPPGGGGGSATTVETDLGSTPTWSGKFTITDAAITSTSKVLCWQAPGPYTGKGSALSADEGTLDPIEVTAVIPATGEAVVHWETKGYYAPVDREVGNLGARGEDTGPGTYVRHGGTSHFRSTPIDGIRRIGKVKGNVKFSYLAFS